MTWKSKDRILSHCRHVLISVNVYHACDGNPRDILARIRLLESEIIKIVPVTYLITGIFLRFADTGEQVAGRKRVLFSLPRGCTLVAPNKVPIIWGAYDRHHERHPIADHIPPGLR